ADTGWPSRERVLTLVLLVATGLAVYLCYRLSRPFLPALAWALALAVIAHPLHAWLERRLHLTNLAAGVAVVLVAVVVVAPTLWLTQQLGREIARGIDWLQSEQALARWQAAVEEHPRLVSLLAWLVQDFEAGQALQQLART